MWEYKQKKKKKTQYETKSDMQPKAATHMLIFTKHKKKQNDEQKEKHTNIKKIEERSNENSSICINKWMLFLASKDFVKRKLTAGQTISTEQFLVWRKETKQNMRTTRIQKRQSVNYKWIKS